MLISHRDIRPSRGSLITFESTPRVSSHRADNVFDLGSHRPSGWPSFFRLDTAFFWLNRARAALRRPITLRSIVFVRMCPIEPVTSPRFSLRAHASVQQANEPREKRVLTVFFCFFSPSLLPLPLYSGHSVWWFLQRGGSDCRSSAGGDSSVWNFIFSIASDHFTPDNVQSFFLCVINVSPPKKNKKI